MRLWAANDEHWRAMSNEIKSIKWMCVYGCGWAFSFYCNVCMDEMSMRRYSKIVLMCLYMYIYTFYRRSFYLIKLPVEKNKLSRIENKEMENLQAKSNERKGDRERNKSNTHGNSVLVHIGPYKITFRFTSSFFSRKS